MLKALNSFGKSIGIVKITPSTVRLSYQASDYQLKVDEKKELVHLEYLYRLDAEETNRLNLLESKTSQLIAQTGIIFSLLSLFVPLLIDKIADVPLAIKIFLSLLVFLAFLAYMFTISNALKNFQVNAFKYSRPSTKNVITFQNKEIEEFYNEVIKDLIEGLKINSNTNNIKATNLLHSYNTFKIANILMGTLVAAFCVTIFFFKPEEQIVTVKGNIEVKQLKEILEQTDRILKSQDTLLKKVLETQSEPVFQNKLIRQTLSNLPKSNIKHK